MTLTSLSVRELNEAARAVTRDLIPEQNQTLLTAQTPYITSQQFRIFLRLYNVYITITLFRQLLSYSTELLDPQIRHILAADVPTQWCISISNQKSRHGITHVIPINHLSPLSQTLAQTHQFARSFAERLNPHAKTILGLTMRNGTVSYPTAAKHCGPTLSRSSFYSIQHMLATQERNFPWKP